MSTRTLVSYDDISYGPDESVPTEQQQQESVRRSPNKRQKKHHKKTRGYQNAAANGNHTVNGITAGEDSRDLSFDEIWDDSALIDAWNSAMEEYEAYHGPGTDWKIEPTKKSPLWYNIPPTKTDEPVAAEEIEVDKESEDSKPLDFDSFEPTHDPSLSLPPVHPAAVPGQDYSAHFSLDPTASMVSQDEAFNRVLGAMYWGGYYTAIYHHHRQSQLVAEQHSKDQEEEVGASLMEYLGEANEPDGEEYVATQR